MSSLAMWIVLARKKRVSCWCLGADPLSLSANLKQWWCPVRVGSAIADACW